METNLVKPGEMGEKSALSKRLKSEEDLERKIMFQCKNQTVKFVHGYLETRVYFSPVKWNVGKELMGVQATWNSEGMKEPRDGMTEQMDGAKASIN